LQVDEPLVLEKKPKLHGVHSDPDNENVPGGHGLQSADEFAPDTSEDLPLGQDRHTLESVAPVTLE
jgi:hypothetical protein